MDILMGNDEFILYIRKHNGGIGKTTTQLGREIWKWMEENIEGATQEEKDKPCLWGDTGGFINENNLPKTATQFRFDRKFLPQLYSFLDSFNS